MFVTESVGVLVESFKTCSVDCGVEEEIKLIILMESFWDEMLLVLREGRRREDGVNRYFDHIIYQSRHESRHQWCCDRQTRVRVYLDQPRLERLIYHEV